MLAPSLDSGRTTRPSLGCERSTGTTATPPSGTAAPVDMRIASRGRSAARAGAPARDSPTTGRSPPSVSPTT
jgi:hypothetical protein